MQEWKKHATQSRSQQQQSTVDGTTPRSELDIPVDDARSNVEMVDTKKIDPVLRSFILTKLCHRDHSDSHFANPPRSRCLYCVFYVHARISNLSCFVSTNRQLLQQLHD